MFQAGGIQRSRCGVVGDIDLHMKQQYVIEFLNAGNIAPILRFTNIWRMCMGNDSVSTVR